MIPLLSVIIPCYNESKRLPDFFALIEKNLDLGWEWLFVDDGSTDETAQLIADFATNKSDGVQLISLAQNQGKGNAVKEGMLAARGQFVGFVDADLAASPLDFRNLLSRDDLKSGREIIIGSRLGTSTVKINRYWYRHLMGRAFQLYTRLASGLKVYDSQCGFKLMPNAEAKKIANLMTCPGFAFDVELLLVANSLSLKIVEIPINWQDKGGTSIRLKHIFKMMVDILKIRARIHGIKDLA